eukprot:6199328-Pleurochrysis_carterae.AAC.1
MKRTHGRTGSSGLAGKPRCARMTITDRRLCGPPQLRRGSGGRNANQQAIGGMARLQEKQASCVLLRVGSEGALRKGYERRLLIRFECTHDGHDLQRSMTLVHEDR